MQPHIVIQKPTPRITRAYFLSVGLSDTLKLVFLLDGVAVGASLGGVDELIGQALGDALDVTERSLPGAGAEEPDSLVDAPEG